MEYLATNGADPLLTDERRHNTCLHFAALYGHSECVHKLLGSRAGYRVQGRQLAVAHLPCTDGDPSVRFIDRHNGWGLSALHIAVFQGSVSTGARGTVWSRIERLAPGCCTLHPHPMQARWWGSPSSLHSLFH